MTSCMFSLFFLLFLCSSITANSPTGLKVRITDKATDVLKDYGLKFLRKLVVNQPFQDFQFIKCNVKHLTLTCLDVDRDNVVVTFQEGSGLQFKFKDLSVIGKSQRDINNCFHGPAYITGGGVDVTIRVRLIQNQGRLSLEIPPGDDYCKTQAESFYVDLTGKTGVALSTVQLFGVLKSEFNKQFCPVIIRNMAVPEVNNVLAGVIMPLSEGINLDYSLSRDVTVTKNSLDVPFTGVVYYGDRRPDLPAAGVEPVFTESNLMAYVGVSEDLFKSASQALYSHGPFEVNDLANYLLNTLGLPKGPVEVRLTEVPVIKINKEGISVNVKAIAQSKTKSPPPPLPVECQFEIKVNLIGRRLILESLSLSKCKGKPETTKGKAVAAMAKLAMKIPPLKSKIKGKITSYIQNWFNKEGGIQIPLPNGLDLTQTQIDYYDGYFVVGGDLTFTGK